MTPISKIEKLKALEKERDAALEQCEFYRKSLENMPKIQISIFQRIEKAEKERDEARMWAKRMRRERDEETKAGLALLRGKQGEIDLLNSKVSSLMLDAALYKWALRNLVRALSDDATPDQIKTAVEKANWVLE